MHVLDAFDLRARPLPPTRRDALKRIGVASVGLAMSPRATLAQTTPIDIAVGRQLFVDDTLIASTTLRRVYHTPAPVGVVLQADRWWELPGTPTACAMPYSDGVHYDPREGLWKLWYLSALHPRERRTCLAVSADGVNWTKRNYDVLPATNVVLSQERDSQSVIRVPDPIWPFKLATLATSNSPLYLHGSQDGIHWTRLGQTPTLQSDRNTVFWNPFRQKYVFSIRGEAGVRYRLYEESETFVPTAWNPRPWLSADALDWAEPGTTGHPPQLYNLDCVPYESLIVGLFTIFRGDYPDRPKANDVCVGFSRDGFTWHRPERRSFIGRGPEGSWKYGNVQSGGMIVADDYLGFYYSGRAGVPGTNLSGPSSTGLEVLRRDGFASLDGPGVVVTPPVTFTGRHLFVNVDTSGLQAELLSPDEQTVHARSVVVSGNSTRLHVPFPIADLSPGIGLPLKFRFRLNGGSLNAFWLAHDMRGRSGGYINGSEADWSGRDL